MENWEIAAALERMAGLLALTGEKDFKVRAYSHAARQILRCPEPLHNLIEDGRLTSLPGVGKALAEKIEELASTGHSQFLTSLESEVSPELLALFSISGVGYKTAAALVEGLKLRDLSQLEKAAEEGRVSKLPGLGKSLEESIKRYFCQEKDIPEGLHRGVAVPLCSQLLSLLHALPFVEKAAAAGEIRRGVELVSGVLVLAILESEKSRDALKNELWRLPGLTEVAPSDEGFVLSNVTGLPVELSLTDRGAFPTVLASRTGSKGHWQRLEELAGRKGMRLKESGLFQNGSRLSLDSEEELYQTLGLSFIPPELRENRGELEDASAGTLPVLVEIEDIKGDLHLHTSWSDGTRSIREMALEGAARGYQYIAVTDHSQSLKIAGGLTPERLRQQQEEIARLNETGKVGCYIFSGAEMDIKSDGSPDLPDEILKELDIVIASVHSNFRQSREEMTERICRIMEHPLVQIIGHPTGRLLGSRGGYQVDVERLIQQAAITGTALEINSSPQRLDLTEEFIKQARDAGVRLVVNTDAHSSVTMDDMSYGVTAARRGWLKAADLLNTLPRKELQKALQQKKQLMKHGQR